MVREVRLALVREEFDEASGLEVVFGVRVWGRDCDLGVDDRERARRTLHTSVVVLR